MFIPLSKENFFIVVNYKVDNLQNAQLDFTLSHLKINLCLPYILKLYQMLMDAIGNNNNNNEQQKQQQHPSKSNTTSKHQPVAVESTTTTVANDGLAVVVIAPAAAVTPTITSTPPPTSTLVVRGKLGLPEVVLFAEPEKLNSKTLIMNTELVLSFESRAGVTELDIELTDLGLRLGENMNSSKRQGVPFLNPCSARVTMRQSDVHKPAQYKAFINSLYLNMTPTMYEVVMGVINTINKTGTEQVGFLCCFKNSQFSLI